MFGETEYWTEDITQQITEPVFFLRIPEVPI